jgi:protein arginine N-methyltransferase 1
VTEPAADLDVPGLSDEDYFDSYADPGVHRLMIADHVRTDAYRRALEEMVAPGSTVLDVGTGTGILSLFAARAGARRVYAVDRSSIIETARDLAKVNGQAKRIEFSRIRAEDLKLKVKVDLLVSEWMGFFALAECMFSSVIAARDQHLAPGGHMMPSHLRLDLAAIEDKKLHDERGIGMWERPVYGFDYGPMIERELGELLTTACDLPPGSLLSPGQTMLELDCATADVDDFFFDADVDLPIERDATVHGLGGWFEVDLSPGVTLSTSPNLPSTHWRQSFFPLRPFPAQAGDVLRIKMRATPREWGDRRLPLYFTEGSLLRTGTEVHRFFYAHAGSFE